MGFVGKRLPEILVFSSSFAVLLCFAFRSPVWYDDSCHYLAVKSLSETGIEAFGGNPFSTFVTVGPAVNYPCSWFMKTLGISMLHARLFMIFYAILALIGIYFLTINVYNDSRNAKTIAVWAVGLTAFTIQFSVYGSQVLGEVPAMAWMAFGMISMDKRPVFAGICFGLSGLCKEYVAAPLLALLLYHAYKISWKKAVMAGNIAFVVVALYYVYRFGNAENIASYWAEKVDYRSEFLALSFTESLRFLLSKPLVVLGTVALIYRSPGNILVFQLALIILFLMSAGYDRFGLWLVPGAAIGIAPYMRYFISEKRIIISTTLLIAFVQTTPYKLVKYMFEEPNTDEKKIAEWAGNKRLFTYELPLAIFCENVKLPSYPPAVSHLEPAPKISKNEYFVSGPYSHTEYKNYSVPGNWLLVYRLGIYQVYTLNDAI